MNPTHSPMKNPRHELFAQAIAHGEYADTAYETAGFKNHRSSASRLLAIVSIQKRVAEVQAENNNMSQIQREQALSYLTAIALTPIGEVTASSPLCQSFHETTTPDGGTTLKVTIPCKLKALALLGKWCGWETGTQAEQDAAKAVGGVAEMMHRIRARK